jgi:peptidoglycan hydrolase-like protein with peptidoglycan-binding domain
MRFKTIFFSLFLAPLLLASVASAQTSISYPANPSACVYFTHYLHYGTTDQYTGGDVSRLQSFLNTQGFFNYAPVGIFGPLTYRAVQQFQTAHGISPVGAVGPITRNAIQQVSCGMQTGTNAVIYSMSPSLGVVGATVSITGFGFTNDNTVHFGSGVIMHVNGTNQTITFTVPSSLNPACYYSNPRCLMASMMTAPGAYNVYVENSNGTSNAVTFTVTAAAQNNPVISYLSPSAGSVGTQVVIYGSGFAGTNSIYFGGSNVSNAVYSNDGASLTFTVPSYVGANCPPNTACPMYARQITPGAYSVYVNNQNGASNAATFTVQ